MKTMIENAMKVNFSFQNIPRLLFGVCTYLTFRVFWHIGLGFRCLKDKTNTYTFYFNSIDFIKLFLGIHFRNSHRTLVRRKR